MTGDQQGLESMLGALASDQIFPTTPPIHERVGAELAARVQTPSPARSGWWARPRLAATMLLVLAVVATMGLSSGARQAAADLLGVLGIEITFGDVEEEGLSGPAIDELHLGRAVSEKEAAALVSFEPLGPDAAQGPVEIFYEPAVGTGGMVSTVFTSDDTTVLVTEFEASLAEDSLKKLSASGTDVTVVRIGEVEGYWIEGAPHVFGYTDDNGIVRSESQRLAGDVLLWSANETTYRIEGAASLRHALSIASDMGF